MLATGYTDLFRGLPLIIVLYLVGYGIPGLGVFPRLPAEVWGTIAIILTYSSYIAEVLRAGMEAVHPSQRLAARSLGLSHAKTLRLVVLPQAIRKVTPTPALRTTSSRCRRTSPRVDPRRPSTPSGRRRSPRRRPTLHAVLRRRSAVRC